MYFTYDGGPELIAKDYVLRKWPHNRDTLTIQIESTKVVFWYNDQNKKIYQIPRHENYKYVWLKLAANTSINLDCQYYCNN